MRPLVLVLLCLLVPAAVRADRVRVYSVTGVDCGDCGDEIKAEVRKVPGVRKIGFDILKVELAVTMADRVKDEDVVRAIERSGAGFQATVGPGRGAYLPMANYPPGADMAVLTKDGSAIGPLEKLRVAGKYTVFDVYADWCGPCRAVDQQLREIVGARKDVAVRKLNVVSFGSPLARQFGGRLKALPFVVVFDPAGKRSEITGNVPKKLAAALGG